MVFVLMTKVVSLHMSLGLVSLNFKFYTIYLKSLLLYWKTLKGMQYFLDFQIMLIDLLLTLFILKILNAPKLK